MHNPTHKTNKWSAKAFKCVFLGYSSTQKGYKLYHPITKKYLVSKDVIFDESVYYYKANHHDSLRDLGYLKILEETSVSEPDPSSSSSTHHIPIPPEETICSPTPQVPEEPSGSPTPQVPLPDSSISVSAPNPETDPPLQASSLDVSEPALPSLPKYYRRRARDETEESCAGEVLGDWSIAQRKGKRSCVKPRPYAISNFLTITQVSPQYKTFLVGLQDIKIPKSHREGLRISQWKEAMDDEMRALIHNDTWDIVDLPKGKKSVGCRWIFTLKYNADGTLDRHKARLVARGYTQTYGIDYQETFAPVAKLNTIRIMISLAVNLDWPLLQYDIKNAFLNGELKEEIYMDIPPGYENPTATGKVCKLKKALYGLKQSPRAWFGRFSQTMKALGYKQCNGEHTLFSKHSSPILVTLLVVYVDDIIITGSDQQEIKELEQCLAQTFQVKQLGPLKYFLGIEFARSSEGILMTQQKYILDLLEETKHIDCRVSDILVETNHKLRLDDNDPQVEMSSYQKLIGKLLYLSHTRPDICFTVNVLSQFMHSPRVSHFQAANRVLRYLKGTAGLGITYRTTGKLDLVIYTDSDQGSRVDCRSTSGYCTFLGGNLVTWRTKKQSVVSKSSTEAEFRAMSKGIDEVIWIKNILSELKLNYIKLIVIRCDNKSAISIAHDPVYHDRMKHVNIDRFYIQDHLEQGIIKTEYVSSEDQCADLFTKGLPAKQMRYLISKLGMKSIHSSA